jgi:LysR family transcriptional activator of nhaA
VINYKHLHYFWVTARQGGIARASEQLHLTPQTISGQISLLEDSLGGKLFSKAGRNLELTEFGKMVLDYANEIFLLGGELEDAVRNMPESRLQTLRIGVVDVVPKLIAYRVLSPALRYEDPVKIVCRESDLQSLMAELALHRLDLVIADEPVPPGLNIRAYNHVLGDCGISFLAEVGMARFLRCGFPRSLDGAPLLFPSEINRVHGRLLQWFEALHIHPRIVGEFDDSALMKAFGQAGSGVFVAPTAIAEEVAKQYNAAVIGATEDVREQFYAISVERRISNPAVAAITENARAWLA